MKEVFSASKYHLALDTILGCAMMVVRGKERARC